MAGTMNRDSREAYMANYIMNKYHPSLLTLHLITTDYAQHQTGLSSDRTIRTVESADAAIGLILDNLRLTKAIDSTVVIVTGDHGFVEVNRQIAPNTLLVKADILGKDYGSQWKACFYGAGAMGFLYLKKDNDMRTLKKVKQLLESVPDSVKQMFRIIERPELRKLGCDPRVTLAIEPIKRVTISNSRTGEILTKRSGGSHGYSCGIDHTVLVAYGAGISKSEKAYMNQTDIKEFILKILGF